VSGLLNKDRPPVFCPGCTHERIVYALDQCFQNMGLQGHQVVMVSDIGCSGLFDTFFDTHAFHGLHGRALTYATGLKLARPELKVVATMGDGGIGIGGAHILSACRRNLDLTLLILNNFNFGMTGGQFSATTPPEARVASGFLNRLEKPIDICQVVRAAGASYLARCSGFDKDLPAVIEGALRHEGFAVIDIWGLCPGRYTRRNKLTPRAIEERLARFPPLEGPVRENTRKEYGLHYRELAAALKTVSPPASIGKIFEPPEKVRNEVLILGEAGQRIVTAGEILCLAGLTAGLKVTQKNEYDITVLRGPSVSEVILSPEEIGFTGLEKPNVILALGQEGVDRRRDLWGKLDPKTLIIQARGVDLPPGPAEVRPVDLRGRKIKKQNWALAALAVLAGMNRILSPEMLKAAAAMRLTGEALDSALKLIGEIV